MKDTATLMLDTSGSGLYKRGYRAHGVDAPLRETLAAAMVLLSRYRGRDPLCDPFCGSGTIPIEAALIAKNRAPGLNRTFSAQKWTCVDKQLWLEAADEAMDKEFDGDYEIWGGDLDPQAVELARHNAQLAEVDDLVRFEQADACTFHWGGLYGRVVTNPPYGERIMERREAEELYRAFGKAWAKFPGRVAAVSALLPHRVRADLRPPGGQKAQAVQRHAQVRPVHVSGPTEKTISLALTPSICEQNVNSRKINPDFFKFRG